MRRRSMRCLEKTSNAQLTEACCDLGGPREGLSGGNGPLGEARRSLWSGISEPGPVRRNASGALFV
jgi:hypothetical protein